jgi:hypothetical protein
VSFVIACESAEDALAQATARCAGVWRPDGLPVCHRRGLYRQGRAAYARAGAQLTTNLTGAMPLNFAAAYSDYHVTGLNPAGNASLTHLGFVAGRFGVSQSRRPQRNAA